MTAPRTLLDKWGPSIVDKDLMPTAYKAFVEKKYDARKFVFTDQVADMMAGLMVDHPNIFIDNLQFALPPYHVTYIEFPIGTFLNRIGQRSNSLLVEKYYSGLSRDNQAGYLIVGRTIHVLVETEDGKISLSPMVYKMYFEGTDESVSLKGLRPIIITNHEGPPVQKFIEGDGTPRQDADEWRTLAQMLGSTMTNPKFEFTQEQANFLMLNQICVEAPAIEVFEMRHGVEDSIQAMMDGSIGEVRNILMCLLWLNQPRLIDIETVPAARGYYKGKFRPYSAYHLVDIKKEVTRRRALNVFREHSKHRRHEVQAYFRNFNKHEGCEHQWPLYPDQDGRWVCPSCGQWRVRVKEHMRGDASVGFVSKDYLVK